MTNPRPYSDKLDLDALAALVRRLPARERRIFLLAARDSMPVADIARALETSIPRVERLLARALARLDRHGQRER